MKFHSTFKMYNDKYYNQSYIGTIFCRCKEVRVVCNKTLKKRLSCKLVTICNLIIKLGKLLFIVEVDILCFYYDFFSIYTRFL